MSARVADDSMAQEAELRARFEALLERHGPGLRRVARAYAARTDETEDLLQEIALAVWRALGSFRGERSERTFVFRVAHNRGLSFVERRRHLATEALDPEAAGDESPEETLGEARRRESLWRGIRPGALFFGLRLAVTCSSRSARHSRFCCSAARSASVPEPARAPSPRPGLSCEPGRR